MTFAASLSFIQEQAPEKNLGRILRQGRQLRGAFWRTSLIRPVLCQCRFLMGICFPRRTGCICGLDEEPHAQALKHGDQYWRRNVLVVKAKVQSAGPDTLST